MQGSRSGRACALNPRLSSLHEAWGEPELGVIVTLKEHYLKGPGTFGALGFLGFQGLGSKNTVDDINAGFTLRTLKLWELWYTPYYCGLCRMYIITGSNPFLTP